MAWPNCLRTWSRTMLSAPPLTATSTRLPAGRRSCRAIVCRTCSSMAQGVDHGTRLQLAFLPLFPRIASSSDRASGAHGCKAYDGIVHHGADHNVQVHRSIGREEAE